MNVGRWKESFILEMASYRVVRTGPYNQGALCPILFLNFRNQITKKVLEGNRFLVFRRKLKLEIGNRNHKSESRKLKSNIINRNQNRKISQSKNKTQTAADNIVKFFAPSPFPQPQSTPSPPIFSLPGAHHGLLSLPIYIRLELVIFDVATYQWNPPSLM